MDQSYQINREKAKEILKKILADPKLKQEMIERVVKSSKLFK